MRIEYELMFFIIDLIDYYINPIYVIIKGVVIDNRAIMLMGANAEFSIDDFGNKLMKFRNHQHKYYVSSIHKRIWSRSQLKKWRKIIGNDSKCLQKINREWVNI